MGYSTQSFYGEKLQLDKSKAVNVTVNGAVAAIEKVFSVCDKGTGDKESLLIERE
jgi:hypothetical protein